MTRPLARTLAPAALALATACGAPVDGAADTDSDAPAPDCTRAPTDLTWTDATTGYEEGSLDYALPWDGTARTIAMNLWYPTDATEGEAASYEDVFADPHALVGAPFADPAPGCKLPLVVYSHGSQSWGGSASTLVRHLVRQGWVAAAPDHTGNVFIWNTEPHPTAFSLVRVEDVRRTIDWVRDLPEGHPLHGRVDTDHVLVVGHSYGAQTAWLTAGPAYATDTLPEACDSTGLGCTEAELGAFASATADPRVVATMPLDGWVDARMVAPTGWDDVAVPIFAQSRPLGKDAVAFLDATRADVTWISVEGACHESFTGNPLECPGLEKDVGLGIVDTYFSAFAAKQVLHEDSAQISGVLDGTIQVSDLVTWRSSR